jgi:integrase
MKFTESSVAKLRLPTGKTDHVYWDPEMTGFGVRVRPTSKVWRIQYRVGRQQRSESLGDVSKVSLADARAIARKRFALIELGRDPGAERMERRRAATAAELTLGNVASRYLAVKEKKLAASTFRASRRYLTEHWKPLAGLPIETIKRAQIAARLQEIATDNGVMAARAARRNLSALFAWAAREGLVDNNPAAHTNDPGDGARPRDRVLNDDEIRILWRATEGGDDFNAIVRLLLLTGCRREEIGGLRWEEFDAATGRITIAAHRVKNRRQHELTLPPLALEIVQSQPRGHREYVFGRFGGFRGWSSAAVRLNRRIAELNGEALRPFVLHDARRTAATHMHEIGIEPHIVEAVLNHASGHKGGVAGVYNLATYRTAKATALARWAEHLSALIKGQQSNILTMPQRA